MSEFLPNSYDIPEKESGFMKFKDGENRFRVLGSAITGFEWWTDSEDGKRKPNRVRTFEEVPSGTEVRHFWAFPVWNYEINKIQILEVTQSTIQKAVLALTANPKWGDPKAYDIVVSKSGEKLDTEYQVTPDPKEELAKEIGDIYVGTYIRLPALYEGLNPFEEAEKGA